MNLHFFSVCVVVISLAGCAGNPMKPDRPDGKRVPVNVTPPPVYIPAAPPTTPVTDDNSSSGTPSEGKEGTNG